MKAIKSIPFVKQNYIFFVFSLMLFVILFNPVFAQLCHLWFYDLNNSHGILAPFISLYFIWIKKDEIKHTPLQISHLGLGVMIFGLLLYLLGLIGFMAFLQNLSLVITFIGLTWYHMGTRFTRKISFPLFILFFMVPIPISITEMFSFPLKLLATRMSEFVLGLLSIPVLREGNLLHLPNGTLEVAKACSGLRSFISFTMLGLIFAYLLKNKIRKLIIILAILPITIFTNILRITLTGSLAYFVTPKMTEKFLHEFLGIFSFVCGFSLMFLCYYKISLEK